MKLARAISKAYIFKPMNLQARRLQVNLTPSRPSLVARCPSPKTTTRRREACSRNKRSLHF
ncbi:hypothetical protein ATS74_00010 [Pseudoalteromonas sp. H103]|nr:hypothetical protein ATS74_00010 [Pseudoalteromonas sp. H103]